MNPHYTAKAFEACPFNPLAEGKMIDLYPIIKEIIAPEWAYDPALDLIIRYTILVYDPKSPLVAGERDLNYRKGIAAEMAGWDMEYIDQLTALYSCNYPMLVEFTVKYLMRFPRSREWAAIIAYEFKFWEAIRLIMQPISSEKSDREQLDAANKKDVLSESVDQGLMKIDQLYRTFFGEDEELLHKAKKRLTPELMAERK